MDGKELLYARRGWTATQSVSREDLIVFKSLLLQKRTVIVGGGLSGLACATQLEKENHDYIIIEKSSRLGGRVGSVYEDGFIFDIHKMLT